MYSLTSLNIKFITPKQWCFTFLYYKYTRVLSSTREQLPTKIRWISLFGKTALLLQIKKVKILFNSRNIHILHFIPHKITSFHNEFCCSVLHSKLLLIFLVCLCSQTLLCFIQWMCSTQYKNNSWKGTENLTSCVTHDGSNYFIRERSSYKDYLNICT